MEKKMKLHWLRVLEKFVDDKHGEYLTMGQLFHIKDLLREIKQIIKGG